MRLRRLILSFCFWLVLMGTLSGCVSSDQKSTTTSAFILGESRLGIDRLERLRVTDESNSK